jgi:adenosine deaminase
VYEAVHVCGAQRIGHGTHLGEDQELTEFVAKHDIAVEVCLTSNVQTHATTSYEAHPMRSYFDQGLRVVLNTDNRLMSGVTLVDEYEHAARQLHFTFDELTRVALNGFESAFLPEGERFALLEKVVAEVNALRGSAAVSSGS